MQVTVYIMHLTKNSGMLYIPPDISVLSSPVWVVARASVSSANIPQSSFVLLEKPQRDGPKLLNSFNLHYQYTD